MRPRFLFVVGLLYATAGSAAPATVEIFGGISLWDPFLDSIYDASYTPSRVIGITSLFETPDSRSQARQLLTLQGERGWGLGLGVNLFPHRIVGFQFLLDRAQVDVVGANPPHEVNLTWDSINFPNSDPVVRQASLSFEPADTQGTFDELTLSFNGIARFGGDGVVGGSVSGGLSYFRFHGDAERLAALAGSLGGHAVLFTELYEMSYSLSDADAIGFNGGANIDFSLGPHAAIFVDGRLLYGPTTEMSVHLSSIVSANLPTVPLQQIEEFLRLRPVEIDPSYFRFLFGVKLKL